MSAPGTDGLYNIKLVGEAHTYELRGSELHTLEALCHTLSDLTGYKGEFIRDEVLNRMKINERRYVKIAQMWDGERPCFFVKRVS